MSKLRNFIGLESGEKSICRVGVGEPGAASQRPGGLHAGLGDCLGVSGHGLRHGRQGGEAGRAAQAVQGWDLRFVFDVRYYDTIHYYKIIYI